MPFKAKVEKTRAAHWCIFPLRLRGQQHSTEYTLKKNRHIEKRWTLFDKNQYISFKCRC